MLSAGDRPAEKQFSECLSELATHGTVEDEVDGTVDEDNHVEDVTQRYVHVVEEAIVDAAEESEDALRQLGGDEAENDGDEHGRRAGVLAVTVRLVPPPSRPQPPAFSGSAPHCRHKQATQCGKQDARNHLEEYAEQPEIDGRHCIWDECRRLEPVVDGC